LSIRAYIPKHTFEQLFVEYYRPSAKPKVEKLFKAMVLDIWKDNYLTLDNENGQNPQRDCGLGAGAPKGF